MDQWQATQYILAGFGLAAIVGLLPIAGFVWWFARTVATERDVTDGDDRLSKQVNGHETRLRLLEAKQERQTAALEHLSKSIDQLNQILWAFKPGNPGLILPSVTPANPPAEVDGPR